MVWVLYAYFRESAGEFVLDICHKDCEKDDKEVRGDRTSLSDAGALGVGGGARVGFFDFEGRVGVDVLDEAYVLLWESVPGQCGDESGV